MLPVVITELISIHF